MVNLCKKDINRKEDSKSDSSGHGDIISLFLLAALMFAVIIIGIMNNNNLSDKTSAIAMLIAITLSLVMIIFGLYNS